MDVEKADDNDNIESEHQTDGEGASEVDENAGRVATKNTESKEDGKKKGTIIRPNEKRNVPRSHLQALGNLATGVNKMAENSARLKMQQETEKDRRKERDELLKFRREEAEANRKHELALAQIYLQVLNDQTHGLPQQQRAATSMDLPLRPNGSSSYSAFSSPPPLQMGP